ncbi:MAG: hypothetical protein ABIG94_12585 [Pseudomonadota bacterium]
MSLGCQALQIFVQNPRSWKWRAMAPGAIRQFTAARRRSGLGPLVVHLSYLPNLAAAEPHLYRLSAAWCPGCYCHRLALNYRVKVSGFEMGPGTVWGGGGSYYT